MEYLTLSPNAISSDQREEIDEWDAGLDLEEVDPVHPLHMEIFNDLEDVMEDEFSAFVTAFCDRAQGYADKLSSALDLDDYHTLQQTAHSLKGSSAQIGAVIVSSIAVRIEHLAQPENKIYLRKLITILHHELNEAIALIKDNV